MPPALFALVVFEIGSHILSGLARTVIFLFMLPVVAGMTGTHVDMESGELLSGWSGTMILLI
jgi:hypothetical protein